MTGYAKKLNENITMSFRVKNKQLLKKYNKIWWKNWKVNEDRFWKQTCLWWWWWIDKNKNKRMCRQYDYKFSFKKSLKKKYHASVYQ